jgi:CRP-like cAMP-binding protein
MSRLPCRLVVAERGNRLLAALPAPAWRQIEPDLQPVELVRGQTLQEAGSAQRYAWFPTTAVVSLVSDMQDGGSTEVAVVGNEGLVGVGAVMGDGSALSGGVVQSAGRGWRMRASVLAGHAARDEAVMRPLLRYTQALIVQFAQTSACHRHHSLQQQLCCWLLRHDDRHAGDELLVTQEGLATLLGVRRESVTVDALKLQKSGLIRYHRGHVTLLDRAGLEDRSCECYAVVRSAYDRLLGVDMAAPPASPQRPLAAGYATGDIAMAA